MSSFTARTDGLTPSWLADRFVEIETKDMRVVEVRLRSFPRESFGDCVDVVRGRKVIWNARLVEDRTMEKGVVTFRYERVIDPSPGPKVVVHSRTRRL